MRCALVADVDLPCDAVLHNTQLDGLLRPFAWASLTLDNEADDDDVVWLRALRRADVAPHTLRVPCWLAARAGWAALGSGDEDDDVASGRAAVVVHVERLDTTSAAAEAEEVLQRAVARQLARHHGRKRLRPGLVLAAPLAGQHAVLRVVDVQQAAGEQTTTTTVVLARRPRALSALQRALLSCYAPELLPRFSRLLSSEPHTCRRLLLVAHAALMPAELCSLVLEQLGHGCVALTAEDVVVGNVAASRSGDAVVLSGLEQLTLGDSHLVLRWLESRPQVLVVLVVHSLDEVEPGLLSPSRVGVALKLNAPSHAQRRALVAALMGRDVAEEVVESTGGFSVRDLQRLCSVWSATGSLAEARAQVVPSALAHEDRFEPSGVTWRDVVGCDAVRSVLHRSILWPMRHPERLALMRCHAPSGVLLYGPPGCGKSMCVNAFAAEAGVNLVQVRAVQLLSRYTGQTEANIRRVFGVARTLAPCVLLFDDLDVLAPSRSKLRAEDTGGAVERLVSTLLNELDGIDTMGGTTGVYTIACTTRPWALDAAILRPGRLDRLVHLGLPSLESRVQLLMTLAHLDEAAASALAWQLESMTCATIASLVRGEPEAMQRLLGKYSMARIQRTQLDKYARFVDSK